MHSLEYHQMCQVLQKSLSGRRTGSFTYHAFIYSVEKETMNPGEFRKLVTHQQSRHCELCSSSPGPQAPWRWYGGKPKWVLSAQGIHVVAEELGNCQSYNMLLANLPNLYPWRRYYSIILFEINMPTDLNETLLLSSMTICYKHIPKHNTKWAEKLLFIILSHLSCCCMCPQVVPLK